MPRLCIIFAILIVAILMTGCGPSDSPVQTAIAQTKVAQEMAVAQSQLKTQQALVDMQATQNAVGIAQQQTQNALVQTQSAMNAQNQIQAALVETQAAFSTQAINAIGTPTPEGTPDMGYNPISSTGVDFSGAKKYSTGLFGYKQFLITLQLPDDVKEITGKYHLEVAAKRLECSVQKAYPNRLYCIGPSPRGGYHIMRLYEDIGGGSVVVYAHEIDIPMWTPTFVRGGGIPSPTPGTGADSNNPEF